MRSVLVLYKAIYTVICLLIEDINCEATSQLNSSFKRHEDEEREGGRVGGRVGGYERRKRKLGGKEGGGRGGEGW